MSCPNSTETGCRCPEHHPGLAPYAADPAAYQEALDRMTPKVTRLRVVTKGPDLTPACTGTYTCSCPACLHTRTTREAPTAIRQPWEARPSRRHLRAA